MGTKNAPGDYDCYANAEPDEPMFVLLARDELAPIVVRNWVERHRAERIAASKGPNGEWDGKGEYPYSITDKEQEALDCAVAMDAWRIEHAARKEEE